MSHAVFCVLSLDIHTINCKLLNTRYMSYCVIGWDEALRTNWFPLGILPWFPSSRQGKMLVCPNSAEIIMIFVMEYWNFSIWLWLLSLWTRWREAPSFNHFLVLGSYHVVDTRNMPWVNKWVKDRNNLEEREQFGNLGFTNIVVLFEARESNGIKTQERDP